MGYKHSAEGTRSGVNFINLLAQSKNVPAVIVLFQQPLFFTIQFHQQNQAQKTQLDIIHNLHLKLYVVYQWDQRISTGTKAACLM